MDGNKKMALLGSAPIPKALLSLGIPTMIGMLINALYNLVDTYFVGGLGTDQMGAVTVAFPLGQIVVGLGLLFGNGAAAYLSRLLGRGDKDTANKVASTAIYSGVSHWHNRDPVLCHLSGTDFETNWRNRKCHALCAHLHPHLHCVLHFQRVQCHDEQHCFQ